MTLLTIVEHVDPKASGVEELPALAPIFEVASPRWSLGYVLAATQTEGVDMTAEMRPMTTTLRGLLLGLVVAPAILGARLSGRGIAHAYTDAEVHYLFQLNELQVRGSDQSKLNLGHEVCAALRAGDRPRADIPVL